MTIPQQQQRDSYPARPGEARDEEKKEQHPQRDQQQQQQQQINPMPVRHPDRQREN